MAPLPGAGAASLAHAGSGRKSMPALPSSHPASLSSVYPPLPSFYDIPPVPPLPPMPGHYALQPKSSFSATFGSPKAPAVSNQKFSQAAEAVLREMNAKLPEGAKMTNGELLKGKKAEMGRLVSVNSGLGEGTWGLGGSMNGSNKDRYADAHGREFAK